MTALVLSTATVVAQQPPSFRPKQIVVSGGMLASGGYPVGDVTAMLRRNATVNQAPFTLLIAESELSRSLGLEGRVAIALTTAFSVELGGSYSKPELGVTISQDVEAPAGAFASEHIEQFLVDVSGIYQLPYAIGRRARAYALGGGGYLRQLHEGRVEVDTGSTLHLGGGILYWLRAGPQRRPLGARAEVRYVRRTGGVEFEDRSRNYPAVSVLAFFGF
jgi:hypothetical protein